MRTAFILAGLATTLVAMNPNTDNESTTESSSLHVPQRQSSPMMRVDDTKPADSGTDVTAHVDNSGDRPEMVIDSKDPSADSADDKPSSENKGEGEGEGEDSTKGNKLNADADPSADKDDRTGIPGFLHKLAPGLEEMLFPETSSSSTAAPTPTMGAAAAASSKGELFHFEEQDSDSAQKQRKRAVAPQPHAAPEAAATGEANVNADSVVYHTVTRTETNFACGGSVNGALATATATATARETPGAAAIAAPPAVQTERVEAMPQPSGADPMGQTPVAPASSAHGAMTEGTGAAMPSGADPMAMHPTASAPQHGALTVTKEIHPSSVNGVQTMASGSVRVHSVSAPVIKSATHTVMASAIASPTGGASHSAFVGAVPSSSGAAVPSGVDPLSHGKDEQMFTGGAVFTGPREMVVMGIAGFLAVMMLL